VGAWDGKWWGGNLKGVWLKAKQWFPDVMSRIDINVMTYDLSSNNEFHECPTDSVCDLDKQVEFYMKTYRDAGFAANVGYEVGRPAYPDPTEDASHQLPLSEDKLDSILSTTQSQHPGGFFWEMYKGDDGQATATEVAQKVCKKVLGDVPRCSGVIPAVGPGPSPSPPTPAPTPPSPAPTPSGGKFRCSNNQCVAASDGISEDDCKAICGEQSFKCIDNQCTAADGGVPKEACEAVCGSSFIV